MSLSPSLSLWPTSPNNSVTVSPLMNNSLASPNPHCYPSKVPNQDAASCRNAWQKIGRSRTKMTVRPRDGMFSEDTLLPIRYHSDDGLCAITLDQPFSPFIGTTDGYTISEAAAAVLVGCVYKLNRAGEVHFQDDEKSESSGAISSQSHHRSEIKSSFQEYQAMSISRIP